jgi:hypothetical protein
MTEETLCAPVPPPHAPDAPAQSPALPAGWLKVDSLDMEAQGIARRADGKVVFVEGALPFETGQRADQPQEVQLGGGHRRCHPPESSQRVRPAARISACTPAPAAAARCSTCTRRCAGGGQAACAGRQPLAPGQGARRNHMLRPIERADLGLPLPGAAVGALRAQERPRCWWAFTSARAATWPTCAMPGAAATGQRHVGAACAR